MKKVVFRGAGVAIVTPFTADGINFPEFGRLIDDQIAPLSSRGRPARRRR